MDVDKGETVRVYGFDEVVTVVLVAQLSVLYVKVHGAVPVNVTVRSAVPLHNCCDPLMIAVGFGDTSSVVLALKAW